MNDKSLFLSKKPWNRIGKKLPCIIGFLFIFFVKAQNPALEMTDGDSNPTANVTNVVSNTTIRLRNNTNNPTGNTFATYANPTALNVTYTLSNQQYAQTNFTGYNGSVFMGYPGEPILTLMNAFGSTTASTPFTSNGAPVGNGIDVAVNRAVNMMVNVQPLTAAGRATNQRWQMADLTLTFSRPVTNPYLQVNALGGTSNGQSYTTEFDYVSSNVPVTFSKISGTALLNVTSTQILNSATTPDGTAANASRGTVQVTGTGITTLTLRIYMRGGTANTGTNWHGTTATAGDGFMIGATAAESNLSVTKTINNSTPAAGNNVSFMITATNTGASNNTGVVVNDLLPSGYTYVSSTASTGTYISGTGVWTIGNLNAGQSANLEIIATVKSTGSYTNTATISGDLIDPDTTNNTASVTPAPVITDTDGDGIDNSLDLDDDNDGISDTVEGFCTSQSVYTLNMANTLAGATFGANGGSFNLVYTLTSGSAVPSLGASFNVPFSYSDFNNTVNAQNHTWSAFNTSATEFRILPNTTALYTGLPTNNTTTEDQSGASPNTSDSWFRYFLSTNRISQLGTFTTTIGNLPTVTGTSSYSSNTSLDLFSSFNAANSGAVLGSGYYARMEFQNTTNTGAGASTLPFGVSYGNTYTWDYTAFTSTAGTGATNAGNRGLITISQNTVTFCNHRDTDGDGTPDYLDLDSDGDGCFDSIEGDENVTKAQINANGSISGSVDAQGVPVLVNTGGAADVGSDQGQGVGSSANASIQDVQCANAFGCTSAMYLSQTASLYNVNTTTNPFTYPLIGTASSNYNAIGINPLNGYMYGMVANTNNIVVINTDGTSIALGAVTGLPSGVIYNSGEIDNLGNYYVKINTNNNQLYRINLTTLTATLVTLSASNTLPDIAYSVTTGLLYGVNSVNGQLVSINPTTGAVTPIGITPGAVNFGAMFASSTGEMYGVDNAGGFYQFNLTTGQRVLISGAPASSANDGAHCVTTPIAFSADLAVTKTDGVTSYAPGTSTTYTVVVSNNGPFGVLGATVADPVPAGIPSANVSYTAAVAGGATTSVTGTQSGAINDVVSLPVGGTVTYTIVVNIPVSYSGNLVNTVTVTSPSNSTDGTPANNTATDTDTQAACYRPAVTAGTILDTPQGITSLGRAGNNTSGNNWPMVRKGAWTVLEAKTKGFVLNRLTTAQIAAIPAADLVEGMMVYNVTLDCLQVNTTGTPAGWACFNTQTCP
ncbi:DUF11 domain-containing protein [Chryseobacterium defluvii]|uniref:Putative repeat protein (TIGR01451 family) n=1 Tax=Chryseobacterium defluvii TaxID=160396 RepID=A0A495SML7_9FLAO|nr:DUF11 domain-containing protein [Chryseobacterium defluvii]RKT00965.1 putative repeat protein (TIGR01451 family) [Chryseobacterium defluvii]